MKSALKKTRSFSLESHLIDEIERTKGPRSASEHVNHLLRSALEMEKRNKLAEEIRDFFDCAPDDRQERRAFQKANLKTWRDE